MTRNDGGAWEELTSRFTGVPAGTYVSRIEPSWKDSSTFFVTFDNHRKGDFTPYVYATTDAGAYVSVNRGQSWRRFMTGLPTVPVHDLRIHPRDRELVAATHGRGFWIVDIAALEQMTPTVVAADAHLFA